MQTFLTHPSFKDTAASLDRERLGKQRVECKQILQTNREYRAYQLKYTPYSTPLNLGWKNHPAVLMWRNHDTMLALYASAICKEWINRGYKDSLKPFFDEIVASAPLTYPSWLTDEKLFDRIIASHRSSLVYKFPEHYQPLFPNSQPKYGYVWPVP
jgi:hypothetical protein